MSVAIGLDVGTSGVKALAVAEDGEIVARAEVELRPLDAEARAGPSRIPRTGGAGRSRRSRSWAPTSVAGIGLSGQMHGLVALDADEQVLRPAILWNDQRTGEQCAEIEERIGLPAPVAATGNRALTGFTAPKLLWLREHEPDVYGRIAHILLPKDYVRLRLCGERAIDVADASGTLLLDVAHRRWSDEVCYGAGDRHGLAAARARVARGLGRDERRHPGRRRGRRPGRGGARRRRRSRRARRCRSCSAPRASCSARCPSSPPTRRRASTRSATRCRRPGTRWA